MLTTDFSTIELEDYQDYAPYWEQTRLRSADYTFTNLWGWSIHYGLEWRVAHNLCWIREQSTPRADAVYWAPLGDWEQADWATMPELRSGTVLRRVPEELCTLLQERLGDCVSIEETPEQWEYLYEQQDLATLAGNKLHKKRNHVNRYIKQYGETYIPFDSDNLHDIMKLQGKWCSWRNCDGSPSLLAESDVVCSALRSWNDLPNLKGGALVVEDNIVAFAVGEALDDETLVVHFEKADPAFTGVYQTINKCFVQHAGQGFSRINREQDSGKEGLRQAKRSYCPSGYLKKHTVRIL